ncbi:hypothetical protein [Nocardiopsis halotolerans]|uniref:hypothetical protein n=1 Tax=Nocardiopsis halotolerans TaxID=124252 RepID=UPI001F4C876E|nr:hypothetical protein [Nocardiopsis halotolerans]
MKKISHRLVLITLAAITASAMATGVSAATPYPQAENLDILGAVEGRSNRSTGLTAEVHQAERNQSGNLLSITWSISNSGDERVVLTWMDDRSYAYEGPYFSGVTAVSSDGNTRYHPVMDGMGACLCSGNLSGDFVQRVEPDEKIAYWSLFSVPDDMDTVTIEIPEFDPIEDVPIS